MNIMVMSLLALISAQGCTCIFMYSKFFHGTTITLCAFVTTGLCTVGATVALFILKESPVRSLMPGLYTPSLFSPSPPGFDIWQVQTVDRGLLMPLASCIASEAIVQGILSTIETFAVPMAFTFLQWGIFESSLAIMSLPVVAICGLAILEALRSHCRDRSLILASYLFMLLGAGMSCPYRSISWVRYLLALQVLFSSSVILSMRSTSVFMRGLTKTMELDDQVPSPR